MSQLYMDIMTMSLTVNCCVLVFNLVPRLRSLVLASHILKQYKTLAKICRHYAETSIDLARILTNQLLLWILILLSLIAMCACDVIKYPFHSDISSSWQATFVETLFAVNIGRYVFVVIEMFMSKRPTRNVQFRADVIHHAVTVICYVLFLSYRQNLLLGLVGIVIESTSIFDEIGRFCKDRERRHTIFYRRLVVVNCVGAICFRGVIPTVFLGIAVFQQSPFTMDYAPLMLFFFSIIFFSVINVWQILTSTQRLMKHMYVKSQDTQVARGAEVGHGRGTLIRFNSRGTGQLKVAKNNLGYLRPCENKNIANHTDEKHNMNNRKEFAKESLEIHMHHGMFFNNKSKHLITCSCRTESGSRHHTEAGHYATQADETADVLFYSGDIPLRDSNSSTDSSQSYTVLISTDMDTRNNNAIPLNNSHINISEYLENVTLGPRINRVRSLSADDVVHSCHIVASVASL